MIDWKEVWEKFDKWWDNCDHSYHDWELEQKAIQQIVDQQLKENYDVE